MHTNFKKYILNFLGDKTGFLGLHTFSNVNVLYKVLLLQDWVFRLGSQLKTTHMSQPSYDTSCFQNEELHCHSMVVVGFTRSTSKFSGRLYSFWTEIRRIETMWGCVYLWESDILRLHNWRQWKWRSLGDNYLLHWWDELSDELCWSFKTINES